MIIGDHYYRFFGITTMIKRQENQLALLNEFSICDLARRLNLKNIIPMIGSVKGSDHVGFKYPKYKMSLREYLINHRVPYSFLRSLIRLLMA